MRAATLTLLLVALGCSPPVTPEDQYAKKARERPLVEGPVAEAPAEGAPPAAPGAGSADVAVMVEAPPDAAAGSSDVLFVFARPVGAVSGPPLAVQRVPAPSFPVSLTIGPADAMIAGTTFPDRVTVTARLDRDGNAMTVEAGDWEAAAETDAPGQARLVLAPVGEP